MFKWFRIPGSKNISGRNFYGANFYGVDFSYGDLRNAKLRGAEFLQDLPSLWLHAGVTQEEREALVKQVFQRITIDGKEFVDIEPKPEYAPLFATMVTAQKVGYQELEFLPSPPQTII